MPIRNLKQQVAETSEQWFPHVNSEGRIRLTREAGEIIADEASVRSSGKIKIVDYTPQGDLPSHKVRVKLVEKASSQADDYRYTARVIDDSLQQNITDAKQDSQQRITESDPLSNRRSSLMSDMNNRTM